MSARVSASVMASTCASTSAGMNNEIEVWRLSFLRELGCMRACSINIFRHAVYGPSVHKFWNSRLD